ncbi:acid phosphatase [Mesorhizobium huakuii]|uniref:alkaline phosphatase family protein n=1 Tax=Mesorhizobium huakuii TaxID=28104 RepID=UPI00235D10C3|nr:alkaline phosphatase family protein [Mesorhizobium huakuii]GLQ81674.1 acid phosphatase [Mesorhizobium huakuii]
MVVQSWRVVVRRFSKLAVLVAIMALSGVPQAVASSRKPPKYDHVVVVLMENHTFEQISLAGRTAPYLNRLARDGALFERSYGVAHPSQPNYLALFSGLTQDVHDDGMHSLAGPNLAARLRAHGKTFAGYVEAGSPRKHNPWESFADTKGFERSLAQFPRDYAKLPSVSFVIPNLKNDMHDGTIEAADTWLKSHLGSYAVWSKKNRSLLIVTFDEDDYHTANHIFTVFYGFGIERGRYAEKIDHYSVLRTIEDIESVPPLGTSVIRSVIASGWNRR